MLVTVIRGGDGLFQEWREKSEVARDECRVAALGGHWGHVPPRHGRRINCKGAICRGVQRVWGSHQEWGALLTSSSQGLRGGSRTPRGCRVEGQPGGHRVLLLEDTASSRAIPQTFWVADLPNEVTGRPVKRQCEMSKRKEYDRVPWKHWPHRR